MKTLIIEDDATCLALLRRHLQEYGETIEALDAETGIQRFLDQLNSSQPFDLICLDIMLPKANGFDVLRQIRAEEAKRAILGQSGVKVIMTTGVSDHKSILGAFREGCEAYLCKPISKKQLTDTLTKLNIQPPGGGN